MSLKRDRDGNYISRFWTNGRGSRRVYENFGKISFKEAGKREAALMAKWKRRRTGADPALTFGSLADAYLEERKSRLSKRGYELAEMAIRCHLKPFFGETRVEDLRAADVERYQKARRCLVGKGKARRVSTRPVAASTLNREWSLIRAILNFGERTERVERNPLRRGAVELLPTKARDAFFEPEEWARFTRAAETAGADLAGTVPFWRVLLLSGRRISELAALRWRDVDFDRGTLRFFQTKTERPVTLPLAGEIAETLRALARFRRIEASALVFLDGKGKPLTVTFLQVAFRRILKLADLGGALHGKLTPHSIRHTAATWARRQGVPLDRIAAVLGHADLRMTMRTYAHIRPEDLAAPLDVLAGIERGAREKAAEERAAQ